MNSNTNPESEPVQLTYHGQRRFTLPFVSNTESVDEANIRFDTPARPFQIHDYILSPEELENERPFMHGRVLIPPEVLVTRPIFPVRAREILSDEEIENERPFMTGRKKINPEAAHARAHGHLYEVLSDEEWENEHPFMHGRNRIPQEVFQNRRFLQVSPALGTDELENERPFMHGRKKISPELEGRRHQRRIIDFFSDGEVEFLEPETRQDAEPRRKLVQRRRRRSERNQEAATKKRICTPCQKFNEFRKDTLVPAVKSVRKFMRTRATSAKENITVAKEVIASNEFKEIRTKLVKKPMSQHEDNMEELTGKVDSVSLTSKLSDARKETVFLFNARRADRLKRGDSRSRLMKNDT